MVIISSLIKYQKSKTLRYYNSQIKKTNMKNKTYFLNGKKCNFDILVNTISPDLVLNNKFEKLKYIGRFD